jgi:hypothetical protein
MSILLLITQLAVLIAASDDSSEAAAAPLLLLLSGFIFYAIMYARYRNANKRNTHESETTAHVENMVATDAFVKHVTGLSNAQMRGANHNRVEGALNTGGNTLLNWGAGILKQ